MDCLASASNLKRLSEHDARSALPVPATVGLGYLLAHPAARLHGRPGILHRRAGRPRLLHRQADLGPPISVLDADLRRFVRHGCRVRHRHALPDGNELESLLGQHRKRSRAPARLRGPDGVFPRGLLSRRAALWPEACAGVGAFLRRPDGRGWHPVLDILDPVGEQLDANASGLSCQRRSFLP